MIEVQILRKGGVGVMPTDTLYGVVASAHNEAAVKRVYELKGRTPTKPCIILVATIDELESFGVSLTVFRRGEIAKYWPGPMSIVLSCDDTVPEYLHRGTHTLAFRLPNDAALQLFLKESGPLIAPSANPEGLPPATTVEEAKNYFGDTVDFYLDGGIRAGLSSTLIAFDEHDGVVVVREGRHSIKE